MAVAGNTLPGAPRGLPLSTGRQWWRVLLVDLAEHAAMDVRALLQEACDRARISQADLARKAGSDPSLLSAWATGRVSPTVGSLARVLAAVDLQVRPVLEPLLAELDGRVDAVLSGAVALDLSAVEALAEHATKEQRWGVELPDGSLGTESGPLTWAFDGATALAMHGLAFPQDLPAICVLFDDAARSWLTKGFVLGAGHGRISFWSEPFELVREHLRGLSVGRYGTHLVRVVEVMPATVRVQPPGAEWSYPVLTLSEVEAAHPALADVLVRLRDRARPARRTGED